MKKLKQYSTTVLLTLLIENGEKKLAKPFDQRETKLKLKVLFVILSIFGR